MMWDYYIYNNDWSDINNWISLLILSINIFTYWLANEKGFLKKEWKVLLLLILILIITVYFPSDNLDAIRVLVIIVYSVIIYKFFGGYAGDYDNEITTKEKLLNFITIPKVIFFIIFLVLLYLYSNEARIINHLLDAYMCRGLEEGLPPVSSGCYDLTPRDN